MKSITKLLAATITAIVLCSSFATAQSISANESLTIRILGVPASEQSRVSGEYNVDPKGYVYMPLLKNGIKANGMSYSSLARKIEAAYKAAGMYTDPRIAVSSGQDSRQIEQREREVVSIGGYVKSPGQRPFISGMTLFQAVSAAGGETAFGSIYRVELIRKGRRTVYNLKKTEHMTVRVYPGDTINVPQKDWRGR